MKVIAHREEPPREPNKKKLPRHDVKGSSQKRPFKNRQASIGRRNGRKIRDEGIKIDPKRQNEGMLLALLHSGSHEEK